jgi:hypothetical protein
VDFGKGAIIAYLGPTVVRVHARVEVFRRTTVKVLTPTPTLRLRAPGLPTNLSGTHCGGCTCIPYVQGNQVSGLSSPQCNLAL